MSRKKTPDTSKLTRVNAAPYTLRKTEPSDTKFDVAKDKGDKKVEAKVDVKTLVVSDGKVDAKFDDVKSGPVNVEPTDGAGPVAPPAGAPAVRTAGRSSARWASTWAFA